VLFGRNDAGKSNILDAIALASGLELGRTDPLGTEYESEDGRHNSTGHCLQGRLG
jgi:AAA15 family ATPase/GTPase